MPEMLCALVWFISGTKLVGFPSSSSCLGFCVHAKAVVPFAMLCSVVVVCGAGTTTTHSLKNLPKLRISVDVVVVVRKHGNRTTTTAPHTNATPSNPETEKPPKPSPKKPRGRDYTQTRRRLTPSLLRARLIMR